MSYDLRDIWVLFYARATGLPVEVALRRWRWLYET